MSYNATSGSINHSDTKSTTSTSYANSASDNIVFQGSTLQGTPKSIAFNVYLTAGTTGGSIRIIDSGNGDAVICEITGITSTDTANIATTTTIANVGTVPTKWVIQIKAGAGDTVVVKSTSILF